MTSLGFPRTGSTLTCWVWSSGALRPVLPRCSVLFSIKYPWKVLLVLKSAGGTGRKAHSPRYYKLDYPERERKRIEMKGGKVMQK